MHPKAVFRFRVGFARSRRDVDVEGRRTTATADEKLFLSCDSTFERSWRRNDRSTADDRLAPIVYVTCRQKPVLLKLFFDRRPGGRTSSPETASPGPGRNQVPRKQASRDGEEKTLIQQTSHEHAITFFRVGCSQVISFPSSSMHFLRSIGPVNRSPSLIFWPGSRAFLHSRIRIAVGLNNSTALVYPSAKHYPVLNTQSTTLHVCCRHAPRLPPLPVPGFSCIWPFRTEIALVSPNRSVGTDLVDLHQSEPGMGDVRTRTRSASDAPRSTKRALLDAESETNTSRRDRRNAV